MAFKDLLNLDLVDLNVVGDDKYQVIENLLQLAVDAGAVSHKEQALEDLFEREQYLSTGFENGLAVPHAKTEAVSDIILVFGLCREGVEFDSLDGRPANCIFLLLSPMETSGPHIQTLALLARNFQNEDMSDRLKKVKDVAELIEIFNDFK